MEVEAITRARAVATIELDSLTNEGRIRLTDCIGPLVSKYDFKKYPVKPEDFDVQDKGVTLESGTADGVLIDHLTIYDGAILVDTLASTETSKSILVGILEWARLELNASYEERRIRNWMYISDLVFRSEVPLIAEQSSPVKELARKTSAVTEQIFDVQYEPSQIWVGHDPMVRKHGIASFSIQHRVNTSFKDNVFFSEAPLPTDLHIKFLEEFEQDVRSSLSTSKQ